MRSRLMQRRNISVETNHQCQNNPGIDRNLLRLAALGEPSQKKMGKVGILSQPGGRGLTESQLFNKISQN